MRRLFLFLTALAVLSSLPPAGQGMVLRRLCGTHLVEALLFVCGEKGVFYRPGRGDRAVERAEDGRGEREYFYRPKRGRREEAIGIVLRASAPYGPDAGVVLQDSAEDGLSKRGIVEQCCHYYCNFWDLENYCNT
ncbi:insulin [Lepisosteus oculatus]|uniref:insulin n=1 Tax=Lepisosteus oculatus TaxID=7918 RepID=UPI0037239C47